MLARISDAPDQIIAICASGTVMAGDVDEAIARQTGAGGSSAAGLVVVIEPDFEGHFAELARGLAKAALAHRTLVKLAVVTEDDKMQEARLSGFEQAAAPVRFFAVADRSAAFDWAAAARGGE
jgi:hypothetical protein